MIVFFWKWQNTFDMTFATISIICYCSATGLVYCMLVFYCHLLALFMHFLSVRRWDMALYFPIWKIFLFEGCCRRFQRATAVAVSLYVSLFHTQEYLISIKWMYFYFCHIHLHHCSLCSSEPEQKKKKKITTKTRLTQTISILVV